jgi:hypothetical protein
MINDVKRLRSNDKNLPWPIELKPLDMLSNLQTI